MTSILAEICDKKRIHVDAMKSSCSLQDVKGRIDDTLPSRSFEQALYLKKKSKTPSVIAEVKKASPSKGVIRENFDPKSIA